MRISDWSSDVCSSDLILDLRNQRDGTRVRKIKLFENAHNASHEEILGAIDRNIRPQTRVLGMTWVHSGSGVKLPIDKIGALVDKHNQGRSDEQRIVYVVDGVHGRSEEHTSELQSLMRISYAVFCLKKKTQYSNT